MTSLTRALLPLPLFAVLTACGASTTASIQTDPTTSAPPASSAPETPVTTSAPAPSTAVAPAPATTGVASYVMPNLVGKDLQTAQDTIQTVTGNPVFITFSHDLLKTRSQVLDRDWQVCTQNVAAGTTFGTDARIDFGVVRVTSETCP